MDQVFAKIKRQRLNPLRRVVSGVALFDIGPIPPGRRLAYDASTILGEDDWFSIVDFRESGFLPEYLEEELISSEIAELERSQFDAISLLLSDQGGDLFFQRVMPSLLLRRKMIGFGDAAFVEDPNTRIVINPRPDAVYFRSSNEMVFRDLSRVSPIFPGIDSLFREATDEEVREFLDQDFIDTREFAAVDVSTPNRKRITIALESLHAMSASEKSSIFSYIRDYCGGTLNYDEKSGTFAVESDDDVKNLVYGIEERFYTTEVRRERRLANSVIRI